MCNFLHRKPDGTCISEPIPESGYGWKVVRIDDVKEGYGPLYWPKEYKKNDDGWIEWGSNNGDGFCFFLLLKFFFSLYNRKVFAPTFAPLTHLRQSPNHRFAHPY